MDTIVYPQIPVDRVITLDASSESFPGKVLSQNPREHLKIVVAIPAYNEEIAIGSVVARCKKYADMVIVVDDGSKDHTAEVARLVGAIVVSHKVNSGYGAAIKTCFETARSSDADILVILDGDGQHSPDDVPLLAGEMINKNADIVIGSRFVNGNGSKQKIPRYRIAGMKVLDGATSVGTGLAISDSQSGFRAYSRKAIHSLVFDSNGMSAGSEILIQAAHKNLKIAEVPVIIRYDVPGQLRRSPISHGLAVLSNIIKLISLRRPLLFFGVPGMTILTLGAVAGFYVSFVEHQHPLYMIVISVMLVMLGMFSICTGFILFSIQNTRAKA